MEKVKYKTKLQSIKLKPSTEVLKTGEKSGAILDKSKLKESIPKKLAAENHSPEEKVKTKPSKLTVLKKL
ncbi:hypothetical protein JXB01_02935 [Candidatus Micrarchaeota archaeon]|nr:hypothetical protein [Candidatus Micrarchaeota archaeon]